MGDLKNSRSVAIHQPNFLPWIGYFHKISCVDTFVFLDDVPLPQGKSFCTRVKIKGVHGGQWLTVPVNKSNVTPINNTTIAQSSWSRKHIRTIENLYGRTPYFERFWPTLQSVFRRNDLQLIELNCDLIQSISRLLGWNTRFVRSSELTPGCVEPRDRILTILKACDAKVYLSGTGAGSRRYVRETEFQQAGIQLVWQKFLHPVYPQPHGEFEPFLSIIDLLFCTGGWDEALSVSETPVLKSA